MTARRFPLEGLRVLELGDLLAGPVIGTLLGEFGAEVIKVERLGRGDVLRQFGPSMNGQSLYWRANGHGKKSIALDLQLPQGRDVLRDLLAPCDVLVASLRPGTLEGWGFDEGFFRMRCPRLIVVHASAFGRSGPYAGKGGYDPIAQGFSGLSYVTGDPEGPPMRAGGAIPVCDFMTGLLGAFGAVLALYDRDVQRSERGQTVDVALYDMAFRMLGPLLAYYDLTGEVWQRQGNRSLGGAPTGHFQTGDAQWVCVSVQNDEQFGRCADLIGHPEWRHDPRFSSLRSRTQYRAVIEEAVTAWVRERPRNLVMAAFEQAGLAAGPMNSVADLAEDEHLAARGVVWEDEPSLGRFRLSSVVPRLSSTPGAARGPAPGVGDQTYEVLTGLLKYSDERLRVLAEGKVIPSAK